MPDGWHAACWPFIAAKAKFILYGAYLNEVLWRANLTYAIGLIGLIWVRKTPCAEAEETAMYFLTAVKILEQAHKYPGRFSTTRNQTGQSFSSVKFWGIRFWALDRAVATLMCPYAILVARRDCEINNPPRIMPNATKKCPGRASPRTVAPITTAHTGT